MELQLRAVLPDEMTSDEGLTEEAEKTMLVLEALLMRYGMTNFQVVRINLS